MGGDESAIGFFQRALLTIILKVFSFQRRVGLWRSRFRCNAASCGQNSGPCCRSSSCLSQELRASQTLQPYSGVWSVVKSGAQRREDRTLTCGDESRNAAETLARKPTSIRATPSWRAASEQTSWLKKERVMIRSILSCTTRTMQLSKQAGPSSTTLGTSSCERKEENDGQMSSHHLKDGTRRTSNGNARRRSWRVPTR